MTAAEKKSERARLKALVIKPVALRAADILLAEIRGKALTAPVPKCKKKAEPMRRRRRGFTLFEQQFLVHLRFGTLEPPFDKKGMSLARISRLVNMPLMSVYNVLRRFVKNGHTFGKYISPVQ